jgi:hypothetical protein
MHKAPSASLHMPRRQRSNKCDLEDQHRKSNSDICGSFGKLGGGWRGSTSAATDLLRRAPWCSPLRMCSESGNAARERVLGSHDGVPRSRPTALAAATLARAERAANSN